MTPIPTENIDNFQLALKISEDFEYMKITLNFGSWQYDDAPCVTAEDLGIEKGDKQWHQLWIELNTKEVEWASDKWHIYIRSEQMKDAYEINTGYEYSWYINSYGPNSVTVFAIGKSWWIPKGKAKVCNDMDAEKCASGYGGHGHLKEGCARSATGHGPLLSEKNPLKVLLLLLLLICLAVD